MMSINDDLARRGGIGTRRNPWLVLAVLSLSVVIVGLDGTVLNTALPTLNRELNTTSAQLEWIVASYTIVFGGLLLLSAAVGDRFGRRRLLTIGLLVFGTGSTVAAFSGSAGMLIAARGFMGIGAALMMPATLSILTAAFPQRQRAKALGLWAGFSGIGIAIGPILGGWLLDHFWWGSVFLINVPIVVLALLGNRFIVPESRDPSQKPVDLVGGALSVVGLGSVIFAIIEGPSRGWTDPLVLAVLSAGLVALAGFALWELRSRHPLLDVRLFRRPAFVGSALTLVLAFFAFAGVLYYMTQYLQFVRGLSPFEAGIRLTPVVVAIIAGAPLGAVLERRAGARAVASSGLVLGAIGLGILSQLDAASGWPLLAAGLIVLGFGVGLAMAPITNLIQSAVPVEHAGSASGVNTASRQIGISLGVAVLGSVLAAGYSAAMTGKATGFPAEAAAAAEDSIGGAIQVAGQAPGVAGLNLLQSAEVAFLDAMTLGLWVGVIMLLAGALMARLMLPGRGSRVRVVTKAPHPAAEKPVPAAQEPVRVLIEEPAPPSGGGAASSTRRRSPATLVGDNRNSGSGHP